MLKMEGLMMIAEVASRITDMAKFETLLLSLGFKVKKKSMVSDYFTIMVLQKVQEKSKRKLKKIGDKYANTQLLKICKYKRR